MSTLRDADGGDATSLLVNATPIKGVMYAGAVGVLATVVGVIGAHVFSMGTGFSSAGLVLAWARWGLGGTDAIIRRTTSSQGLTTLALETLMLVLLAAALAGWMYRISVHRQAVLAGATPKPAGGARTWLLRADDGVKVAPVVLAALVAGCIAGGLVSWIVAVTPLRGQTLMAGVAGALAAAAAGQLLAASMRATLTPVVPVLAVLIVGVAGPIAAPMVHGARLVDATYMGGLLGIARLISLDWAAGALLGVPIGLGWAGAMLDVRAAED